MADREFSSPFPPKDTSVDNHLWKSRGLAEKCQLALGARPPEAGCTEAKSSNFTLLASPFPVQHSSGPRESFSIYDFSHGTSGRVGMSTPAAWVLPDPLLSHPSRTLSVPGRGAGAAGRTADGALGGHPRAQALLSTLRRCQEAGLAQRNPQHSVRLTTAPSCPGRIPCVLPRAARGGL